MATRQRTKGRKDRGSFLMLPHHLLNSDAFASLSPRAVKMLIDIATQYKGKNNGDLSATRSQMKPRGWPSNDQRQKAIKELLEVGFLMVTRLGWLPNNPTLYAITWQPINECGGKLEIKASTTAPNNWQQFRFSSARHTGRAEPPDGSCTNTNIVKLARHAGR